MNINYKIVNSLEAISIDASEYIKANEYKVNLLLAYELPAKDLIQNVLLDVNDKAQEWNADKCPKNLYFNHGQYKIGGIDNIINELKEKPSSNRALYSLIDQKTIMGSGDSPIPSFMLFQSILDGDVLYCNVYLRALEVSKFLRINLEEIRLIIEKIDNSTLSFTKVRLTIFACRAHHIPNFNALERPKLELMTQYKLMKMMTEDPKQLRRNIQQMAEVQTVLSSKSIQYILEIVKGEWDRENKPKLTSLLEETISDIEYLIELRRQHSHDDRLNQLSKNISCKLMCIAEEFTK